MRVSIASSAAVLCACCNLFAVSLWIEGENATRHDNSPHPWWYDKVKTDALSGGAWLSNFDKEKKPSAEFDFMAPEDGVYTFWLRCNPKCDNYEVQMDGNAWQKLDVNKGQRELQNIAEDNKPDLRFLAWCQPAEFTLAQGPHTLRMRFGSGADNQGAIDCLLLTTDGYVPSGKTQPEQLGTKEVEAGPEDAIWIEGENATRKAVVPNNWYNSVKRDLLSAGDWLAHFDEAQEGYAEFDFNVATPGEYTLWLRANPTAAKLSYMVDSNTWQTVDVAGTQRENTNIADDDKTDLRFLAWCSGGKVKLDKGPHTLMVRFNSENSNHGGLDCLVLSRVPFTPSGTNRPTVRIMSSEPGDWFPVVFNDDRFSEASVIDMSKYIEAPAGQHGFLQRDGENLKFEQDEQPVKFWACGANYQSDQSRAEQTQRIKYLRKHGVGMVRQHPVFGALGPLHNGALNAEKLDAFDWWFAELKKHGIYMTWSVFYPLLISAEDGYDPELFAELEVREGGLRWTYGLVNIEPKLQELQLKYVTALLNHTNAYTGLRYADDPELAVIEIQNEDCVFWGYPLNELNDFQKFPKHSQRLRRRWFDWAVKKYGDTNAVAEAWGGLRDNDAPDEGEFMLFAAYHLGADGPLYECQGMTKRAGDFIEFLAEIQREFYERREKEYRALGVKCVTVSTAWKAGGAAAEAANLYCDTACDMIDRHSYFGGGAGGHNVTEGQVNNASHLDKPGSGILQLGMFQVEDHPFAVTEWSMTPPNEWKAEAAPLVAFYGVGLQGWDATYHFLNSRTRIGDGWPNLSKYVTDTPHYIGQFPALFFAIHNNHIKEAPIAAARRLTLDELFTGTDPLKQGFTGDNYDYMELTASGATPMEALAIGRVTVSFDGGEDELVDFSTYWDEDKKTITSMTGELEWDYGTQVVLVKSPKTQGIIGRAGGSAYRLQDVMAKIDTPFVSLIFTPLDDKPLAASRQILITAMARDKQAGAEYNEDGTQLLKLGAPPLLMEPVQATIKLRGKNPALVRALDVYGVPTDREVEVRDDGVFTIDGRYRTYYYEVRR